jgi:hypothetical protein
MKLGICHRALAKNVEMSLAGVGFSGERGEAAAKREIIHLIQGY